MSHGCNPGDQRIASFMKTTWGTVASSRATWVGVQGCDIVRMFLHLPYGLMCSVETKRGAKVCSRIFGAGLTLRARALAIASLHGALTLAMLAATLLMAPRPAQAQTE